MARLQRAVISSDRWLEWPYRSRPFLYEMRPVQKAFGESRAKTPHVGLLCESPTHSRSSYHGLYSAGAKTAALDGSGFEHRPCSGINRSLGGTALAVWTDGSVKTIYVSYRARCRTYLINGRLSHRLILCCSCRAIAKGRRHSAGCRAEAAGRRS